MRRKLALIGMCMSTCLLLTGCWDSVEINERHVVLDLGIDKYDEAPSEENGQTTSGYEVTYVLPDIAKLSGQDSLAEDVKAAMVVKSPTLSKSIDDAEVKTQNTLTLNHAKALVFGEELLKDPVLFKAAIDGLIRNSEISKGINLLAVQGRAYDISAASNYQNPVVGLYIMKYFNNSERGASYAKQQVLGGLIKEINDSHVATIPVISKDDEDVLRIEGAAVMKDYELVDWLDKDEVRGQLLIEGNVEDVPIVVDYKGEKLTYQLEEHNGELNFDLEEPSAKIEIIVRGSIVDYVSTAFKNAFTSESLGEIRQLLEVEINAQMQRAIEKSRLINTDFLDIGLEMYRQEPKLWANYSDNWNGGVYKDFPIHVEVTVVIDNTGTLE